MANQPTFFESFTNTDGRLNRQNYFLFQLGLFGVEFLGGLIASVFAFVPALYALVLGLISIVVLVARLILDIARLHDANMSGWWLLLFLVPFVNIFFFFYLFFAASFPYRNQWGEPIDGTVPGYRPQEGYAPYETPNNGSDRKNYTDL